MHVKDNRDIGQWSVVTATISLFPRAYCRDPLAGIRSIWGEAEVRWGCDNDAGRWWVVCGSSVTSVTSRNMQHPGLIRYITILVRQPDNILINIIRAQVMSLNLVSISRGHVIRHAPNTFRWDKMARFCQAQVWVLSPKSILTEL